MLRPARRTAAALILIFAATPALAATASNKDVTTKREQSNHVDRKLIRFAAIPAPRAPARQPLQPRQVETFDRADRFDSQIPAKDSWFDDQGLRFTGSSLAYKVRF